MYIKKLFKQSFFQAVMKGVYAPTSSKPLRFCRWMVCVCGCFVGFLWGVDKLFPLTLPANAFSVIVVAKEGTPLRAFPDKHHMWRYPITLNEVSPFYIETLLQYEDKYFWVHPGVNPIALMRAFFQWIRFRQIISGGSTITMQVARMLHPTPHTIWGKCLQIARAMQLEWHYSKQYILTLYMHFAPMGGVIEGVETASRLYLGKSSRHLTRAEAALLTVLPQSPSLLRPDRYPQKARIARDKVIVRMKNNWSASDIADALSEPVIVLTLKDPLLAPLLAQRVKNQYKTMTRIDTTIDSHLQTIVESLLLDRVKHLPEHVSMAALVMNHASGDVVAYAGSADFSDEKRFNHVDMVRAWRSPGSTLKPFLYGLALDQGLIHSESLLADTPQSFGGYEPGNFQQNFHGPVSVSEALIKSLNVPAVAVLDQLHPNVFVTQLYRGGLWLRLPSGASPNLSVILGGAATRLEDLVHAYSALARKGVSIRPRLTIHDSKEEKRMMSEGAAFIVRDILQSGGPVERAIESHGQHPSLAWKTGTSFGFRDAWAVGVNAYYTVGVWVGRPDGTPNPGFFGANIAAPLLVDIFNTLPQSGPSYPLHQPTSVRAEKICWPSGQLFQATQQDMSSMCPMVRTAWVLNETIPPTFSHILAQSMTTYFVDIKTGERVLPDCADHPYVTKQVANWPAMLTPWLNASLIKAATLPKWAPRCRNKYKAHTTIKILGLHHEAWLRQTHSHKKEPLKAKVRVEGGTSPIYWLVNGQLLESQRAEQTLYFTHTGRYDITAFDHQGQADHIQVTVQIE